MVVSSLLNGLGLEIEVESLLLSSISSLDCISPGLLPAGQSLEISTRRHLGDEMEISFDEEAPSNCHFSLNWVSWNLINIEKSPSLGELSTGSRPSCAVGVSSAVLEDLALVVDKLITCPSVQLPPSRSSIVSE